MNLDEVVLFEGDISGLPVNTGSTWPINAEGEYHVVDRTMGRWTDTTLYGIWRAGFGSVWRVIEVDGRHVMAQTQAVKKGTPMLVTGDRFWADYALTAQVHYPSHNGPCGLMARYQNSRCYDAVQITRGHIGLLHHENGGKKWLASRGYVFDVDRYYALRVECTGPKITVFVDGEKVLESLEGSYPQGKVGLWAEVPAHYADVVVSTSREARDAATARTQAWVAQEQALRDALPKPALWKKLPTPGFGTDRNLRFGDLNGDGKLEVVLTQRVDLPNGDFPGISCITAMDLDGKVLWQIGESAPYTLPATSDNCFQVCDLDGDGCAEVLFCKDFRICIADGCTGKIIRSVPTPFSYREAAGAQPYARIMGDALYVCNLSGGPRPQEILIKDRYTDIWALDKDLSVLWHHEATTGHFPAAYDIDGDGCDEVMAGYTMIDHDGKVLWELPFDDHQDAIAISRPDPEHPDQIQIGLGAGEAGFIIASAEGEVLKYYPHVGHAQAVVVANLRPELPGLEYATNTFWGNPGIIIVFNCRGEMLESFELTPYASAMRLVNWAGDGQEFMFLSGHPLDGGLIDGRGHRAVMLPDDGHPYHCCTALDLTRDGRDELVSWDAGSIWIYRADAPLPAGPRYRPIRLPYYNESNYMATVSIPNWG